jgi:tetratricopeptide (TPR) repeat protein
MNYRIEQLRFLLREDPSSRVFYQLAELLRKEGQPDEAVEILGRGLERHPRYVAAWVSLGRAQFDLSAIAEAEEAFQRALDLDPQNAVAARMMGETAIAMTDWPRAAKALRLARELAPSDLSLNDKIAHVEAQMAGGVESPSASHDRAASVSRDTAAIRVPKVISLTPEDPFAVASGGDTGVWRLTQEVFADAEVDTEQEAPTLEADFLQPDTLPPVPASESAPDYDDEHEHDDEGQEPDESAEISSEPLPLPTMTLARLAIEQGDLELAEGTLVGLLERNSEHPEAGKLLAEVRALLRGRPSAEVLAAKVDMLQSWLDKLRLASERQASQ